MKMTVDARKVALAVANEFSLGEVEQIQPVDQGYFNSVFKVRLPDRNVFVRINRDAQAFPIELAAYKLRATHGVPVPEVAGYLAHSAYTGYPTVVLEQVRGQPLNRTELAGDQRTFVFERAGAILRQMHDIAVEGYGSFKLRGDTLLGASPSWREYWMVDNQNDADLVSIARDGLVSASEFSLVNQAIEAMLDTSVDRSAFLHNDFHGSHIFTDGREVTGVIDFGNAFAGDPRYDVAMSLFFCEPLEAEAFKRGYGVMALDPMVRTYAIYVAAIKVHWRHRSGDVAGIQSAVEKLRALLSAHRA